MPHSIIRLRPDNFTPPARTPWGGSRLLERYKKGLGIATGVAHGAVGESWELSVSPEFHSQTESGERLGDVLGRDPAGMLGDEASAGRRSTALLLKWLDAGDNLSLQIHPDDAYPALLPGDGGKLEAWYVVEHEPSAGLFLGFVPGTTMEVVRRLLQERGDLSTLMRFVPVSRGDFIVLDPGMPHAVGQGVVLIEPQRVLPGCKAVTYRYWDWNRRYAPDGRPDPAGQPRPLHVEHALAATDWVHAVDGDWLASRRAALGWPDPDAPARVDPLCGPDSESALASSGLRVARLVGTGRTTLPGWNALRALTVVEGHVVLGREPHALTVSAGYTVAVPAALGALDADLRVAHAVLSAALG